MEIFFSTLIAHFDNFGELKIFTSQNKVESFFINHLFLSDSFAPYNQS